MSGNVAFIGFDSFCVPDDAGVFVEGGETAVASEVWTTVGVNVGQGVYVGPGAVHVHPTIHVKTQVSTSSVM